MKRIIQIALVVSIGLSFLIAGDMAIAVKDNPAQGIKPTREQMTTIPGSLPSLKPSPGAQSGRRPPGHTEMDIRDIRGPLNIPDPWLWLYWAGGASLLLLTAALVCRRLRKGKPFREKSAFEIAFEELERAKALMRPGKTEEFSVAISGAIRAYIEERFHLGVLHTTTEEFMWHLACNRPEALSEYSEMLEEFLAHCDLAKFARYDLSMDQMKEMYGAAWHFVDKTRPLPEDKTGDRGMELQEKAPSPEKGPSLSKRLWRRGHGLIPRNTKMPLVLNNGRTLVAGGRS